MKYKVSGTNRETGARMILEFDASNKAMAERRAMQSGMGEVLHCEQVHDPNDPVVERTTHRGEFEPANNTKRVLVLVIIVGLVLVAYMLWPRLRALF